MIMVKILLGVMALMAVMVMAVMVIMLIDDKGQDVVRSDDIGGSDGVNGGGSDGNNVDR